MSTVFMVFAFCVFLLSIKLYIKEDVETQLEEFRNLIARRSINTGNKIKKLEEQLANDRKGEAILARLKGHEVREGLS